MSLWHLLRVRLMVFIYCRLRGKCVVCSRHAPRRGAAYGVCDYCLGIPRDLVGSGVEGSGDDPWADDLRSGDGAPSPSSPGSGADVNKGTYRTRRASAPEHLMDATLAALENYPRLRSVYLENDK